MASQDYSAKSLFWYFLNAALGIVVIFGLIGTGTLLRYSNAIAPSRTIQVAGEGKVDVRPDVAVITASVVTRGADATKVQAQATQKMNAIVAFVKGQGIKDEDIKTTGYNLYPTNRWDPKTGEQIATGYEAMQSLTVKIRGIDANKEIANAIAGGLVPAGANQVSGIQYMVDDPEAQRALARAAAFENAFMKAREMAEQNNVRVARVITFSESSGYGAVPMYYSARVEGKGGDMVSPDLQSGTEEIRVNVNVTYEIR